MLYSSPEPRPHIITGRRSKTRGMHPTSGDEPSSSPTGSGHHHPKVLADLTTDAFALCTRLLSLRDVSNLAMSSKSLRLLAYSDAVWFRLLQDRWPNYCMSSGAGGAREEYLSRVTAIGQFKFCNPATAHFWAMPVPPTQILLVKNEIWVAQGRHMSKIEYSSDPHFANHQTFRAHNARISCMRLFPISETSFFRSEMQRDDTILATSSSDRTIRLWWKGSPQRCFKGHSGPVTVLADTLLGDYGSKFLVSGGEDSTVRLWSVGSGRTHGHPAVTYHGHEKSISFLAVARHKASLLVSLAKDSRVRVWDTMASSSTGSSSCVGMASVSGPPVGMKCYDSLCYIASGMTVTAIDLRTMKSVATIAVHSPKTYSFEMLPSKWLLCTGGEDKAMLWDIRKSQAKPAPIAELGGHTGPVKHLHMDSYKIVTAGQFDWCVNVWETDTGNLANALDLFIKFSFENPTEKPVGFSAMAVDGYRLVTSCGDRGSVSVMDFSNCSIPLPSSYCSKVGSKFWEVNHCSDA